MLTKTAPDISLITYKQLESTVMIHAATIFRFMRSQAICHLLICCLLLVHRYNRRNLLI